MGVYVHMGQGWIKGHKFISTEQIGITVPAAHGVSTRYDSVNFYLDMENREMGVRIVTGTPGASDPVALVQTDAFWEYRLAKITVGAGVTSISQSNITDRRGTAECPFVVGLIEQIDASSLFEQWSEQFDDFISDLEEAASALSGRITGLQRLEAAFTTSSASTSTIDIATHIPTYNPLTDSVEIYVSGIHLASSEYTMSGSVITLATTITHTGTAIDLVVYHVDVE